MSLSFIARARLALNELGYELYDSKMGEGLVHELIKPASTRSHHCIQQVDALGPLILGHSLISSGFYMA